VARSQEALWLAKYRLGIDECLPRSVDRIRLQSFWPVIFLSVSPDFIEEAPSAAKLKTLPAELGARFAIEQIGVDGVSTN